MALSSIHIEDISDADKFSSISDWMVWSICDGGMIAPKPWTKSEMVLTCAKDAGPVKSVRHITANNLIIVTASGKRFNVTLDWLFDGDDVSGAEIEVFKASPYGVVEALIGRSNGP